MNNFVKKNMSKNNLELRFTVGLSGCGKSTFARKMQTDHPGKYKILDKDSIREMLDQGEWSKQNEQFVLKVRDFIIEQALKDGFSVIVHDTNLYKGHWKTFEELAKKYSAELIKDDFTDVDIETCIERDLKRNRSVGEKVIRKQYRDFLEPAAKVQQYVHGLPECIIVDVDGTLAHMNGRGPFDWKRVGEDVADEVVSDFVRNYKENNPHVRVVIMSGRSDECQDLTEEWLQKYDIPYDEIHMRKQGDFRKDSIVKEELFYRWISGRYNTKFVLDDRDQVVKTWRALGLKVFQVADGNF